MSDASSVIREFLIQLGFKIDSKGQAAFDKGMKSVTASAVALGEIVADTAEEVAKAVVKMAMSLDQLYFTSRRVNASGENIKAFGFAIEQLGGNAEGAQSALEGIASFMRSNPGGEGFINSLGVATRDVNGQLRDTELITEDLGKSFAKMPFYMAKVRASMLGIDEKTLLALIQGPGPEADKYREFAERIGLGSDAGADASNRFGEKIRDLKAEFYLLFVSGSTQLIPMLQELADWLSKLPFYAEQFKKTKLGQEMAAIAASIGPLIDAMGKLAETIWKIIGPAVKTLVSEQFKVLLDVLNSITSAIRLITDLLSGRWGDAWKDAAKMAKAGGQAILDTVTGATSATMSLVTGKSDVTDIPNVGSPNTKGTLGAKGTNLLGRSGGPPIAGNNGSLADAVRSFFRSHGYSDDQARGIAAGVLAEGGRINARPIGKDGKPLSSAYGIGQWLKSRQNDFARLFHHSIIGSSLQEQLQFMLWELNNTEATAGASIHSATTAGGAMGAFLRNNMRPGAGLVGDLRRGRHHLSSGPLSTGVSMNQKTDIHIQGVNDPKHAGQVVAASQERVNGNLVRNLKTAVA